MFKRSSYPHPFSKEESMLSRPTISLTALLAVGLLAMLTTRASAALIAHYDATNITQADGVTPATPTEPPGNSYVAVWPSAPYWYDLTSSNNDLLGGSNDPNYYSTGANPINTNPVVSFRGGNYLNDSNGLGFSGDQQHSVFLVTRLKSDWTVAFLFSNDLNVVREGYSFYRSATDTVTLEGGFGDNLSFALGASEREVPIIIELRYAGGGWNGTNMNVYFNGVQQTVSGGSGNAMAFSAEGFTVGSFFGRSSNFDLGELRVYNTALSEAERNSVGVSLSDKWGIDTSYALIPEPASLVLLTLGSLLAAGRRRHR